MPTFVVFFTRYERVALSLLVATCSEIQEAAKIFAKQRGKKTTKQHCSFHITFHFVGLYLFCLLISLFENTAHRSYADGCSRCFTEGKEFHPVPETMDAYGGHEVQEHGVNGAILTQIENFAA